MDESLIIDIWDTFKLYISEKNKSGAADNYVNFLLSQGISESNLSSYTGYDSNLDEAIQGVLAEYTEDDDEGELEDEDNFDSYENDY